MAADGLENLRSLKHVVILMMENRSFDQMLGFLKLENRLDEDVEGLAGGETNYDAEGNPYEVFAWGEDETSFQLPNDGNGKLLDPCHSPKCVKEQLEKFKGVQPGGFVKNFMATRPKDGDGVPIPIPPSYHGLPMGYYTREHLPAYDLLARKFCVCDRWHSSIPGDTWPNRLYAMAGEESEQIFHRPGRLRRLAQRLKLVKPLARLLEGVPVYDVRAFTHRLDPKQWRWYSHDPATLRGADSGYRKFPHTDRENFAYFSRKSVSVATRLLESPSIELHDGFLDDAAKREHGLRQVSWIDPNFIDLKILDPNSNDDHPPADVRAGQRLVLETYEALVNSPDWEDTLLIVVYDEHGGFYDHVMPPDVPEGDPSKYRKLGVRVPALLVGPRVKKGVCSDVFEHTTLISTVLHAFAADPEAAIADMPERVRGAPHLGSWIADAPRTEMTDVDALQAEIDEVRSHLDRRRARDRGERRGRRGRPSTVSDGGAGQPQDLHDWQSEFFAFALAMREAGLPPGQT